MRTKFVFTPIVVAMALISGCGIFNANQNVKIIHASNNFLSDKRNVSGFTAIDVRTVGNVLLSQGGTEAVTVQGSDNVVPLIRTRVSNGVLVIDTDEPINIVGMQGKTILTFIIQAKDLTGITVSGLADVNMDRLSTSSLNIAMAGAGNVKMEGLAAQTLSITVSGLGNIRIAGEAESATITISGAGGVQAPDLKTKNTTVDISGLGGATVWVTDTLGGTISGSGDVSYYGKPLTVKTKTTGLGTFKDLGSK